MKLKPYPKYRDSGVPWLGEVPEHWELVKLRTLLTPNTEKNRPDLPLLSVVREKGVIVRNTKNKEENHNTIPNDLSNYKVVRSGQFVINKMKAWQGSYGVSAFEGIVSPAYFVFELNGVNDKFFHLSIRSKSYVPFFTLASDGVRIGQWDLNQKRIKDIIFFIPPKDEQQQIARYLDWKTAQINKFIRNKRRLIQLLKEQKQNIINQAVTKGINPNVEMKDSGVEWLGQIPAHWEVRRLRALSVNKPSNGIFKKKNQFGSGVPLINVSDIYTLDFLINHNDLDFVECDDHEQDSFKVEYGDQLFIRSSLKLEGIGVSSMFVGSIPTVFECHIVKVSPDRSQIEPRYLNFYLNSHYSRGWFIKLSQTVTMTTISQGAIKNINITLPPLYEQRLILEYIEKETALIDKTISRTEREIELIQEYRSRLVSDVVTGKLDVRGIEIPDFEPVEADLELEEDEESEGEEIDEDE